MASQPLSHQDYTVGWMCALPTTEMAAATAMLDETHPELPAADPQDANVYRLGRVGDHNVVIACLPAETTGKVSAATAAKDMVRSFPSIRFGLMVGVGGGVPSCEDRRGGNENDDSDDDSEDDMEEIDDIRLGDVVVSLHSKFTEAVVQYDFGKSLQEKEFVRIGKLNSPPRIVLNAVARIQADHARGHHKIPELLLKMISENPAMAKKFQYQGASKDRLFKSNVVHLEGKKACKGCCGPDNVNLVRRKDRSDISPKIHYGTIGSADQVMKDAVLRDKWALKESILCFEMEAAGLMDSFPCLVIRGICDYADSHKNKNWQPYAAATAASYAKELLLVIPGQGVTALSPIKELVEKFTETLSNIGENVSKINMKTDDSFKDEVLRWLTPTDYGQQQTEFLSRREPKTGQWLLNSTEFQEWFKQGQQTLFCPGIPGAGKTIMSSIVIDYVKTQFSGSSDVGIAYIYCSYRSGLQQKTMDILLSLLKQLTRSRQELPLELKKVYDFHRNDGSRPSIDEIMTLLTSVTKLFTRTFIMIDALDEYHSSSPVGDLLGKLFSVQKMTSLNLYATSRNIQEIMSQFQGCIRKEISAQNEDILRFVDRQMPKRYLCSKYFQTVWATVGRTIVEAADGMFLLANLHMESLLGQPTIGDLEEALTSLPRGETRLTDTYTQAVERIGNQPKGRLARRVLSWLTLSRRTLSLAELQHALAVKAGAAKLNEKFVADADILGSICAGLIIVDQKSGVIEFVHYTTKEYFERTCDFSQASLEISTICITYLSFDVFSTGFCPNDDSFVSRLQDNPFYDYAARNWGHHAQETSEEPVDLILNLLNSEAKLSGSIQAMMVNESHYHFSNYSQKVPKQMTCVHLAAYFGLKKTMVALLRKGHDPDVKNSHGRTPLLLAAKNGHLEVIQLLLDRGADPNTRDDDTDGWAPIDYAAKNGHLEVVRLLLDRGADPNTRNDDIDGWAPIDYAAKNGHLEVVRLLLDRGVDPNTRNDDTDGLPPIDYAARSGHLEVVRLLLDRGANPNIASNGGWTPVNNDAHEGYFDIVQLLLDRGADINTENDIGQTPLHSAAENDHLEVVRLLLEQGADLDAADDDGWTSVQLAASCGCPEVVQLLLDRGADLNTESDGGMTLFHSAAESGHLEVIKLLLDRGADLDAADYYGWTAFHSAAEYGEVEVIQLLLERGADLDTANDHGRTPFQSAARNGHVEVLQLLQDEIWSSARELLFGNDAM